MLRLTEEQKDASYAKVTGWEPDSADPFQMMVEILTGVIQVYREHAHLLRAVLEVAATTRPSVTCGTTSSNASSPWASSFSRSARPTRGNWRAEPVGIWPNNGTFRSIRPNGMNCTAPSSMRHDSATCPA
jgi:hypothetical protein